MRIVNKPAEWNESDKFSRQITGNEHDISSVLLLDKQLL